MKLTATLAAEVVLIVGLGALAAIGAAPDRPQTAPAAAPPAGPAPATTSAPASRPASQPASKPAIEPGRIIRSGGYVGVLLKSREMSKQVKSAAGLKGIGQAIALYVAANDQYPASLDDLVKGGMLSDRNLASPADPQYRYAYVPPGNPRPAADRVVAYDPVSYNGKVNCLFADGHVAMMTEDDLEAAMTTPR